MNICEKIYKLAKESNDTDKIIIFTNSFKVYGTLYGGENKEKDILTLQDAMICDSFDDCDFGDNCSCDECGCNDYPSYDWLNITNDNIVAFSLLKEDL